MGNADGKEGAEAPKVEHDRFSTVELAPRFDAKLEEENLQVLKKKFPDTPDAELLRFLRARQLDVKDATEMYTNYLKWRESRKSIPFTRAEADVELNYNRCYVLALNDEEKVPLLYFLPREHLPKYSTKRCINFGVMMFDAFMELSSPDMECDAIIDLHDVSFKNVDLKLTRALIGLYQDYFPERLRRAFLVGLPPALEGVWEIVEKLLDERTRHRIVMLKKDELDGLVKVFGAELVPTALGGSNDNLNHKIVNDWLDEHLPAVSSKDKEEQKPDKKEHHHRHDKAKKDKSSTSKSASASDKKTEEATEEAIIGH